MTNGLDKHTAVEESTVYNGLIDKRFSQLIIRLLFLLQEFSELHVMHCILVDSSTVICWTSPFVILGVLNLFCRFYYNLRENPVSKQCRL